jgi:homopolymeric O-antigen transport system permease protein
MFSTEVPAGFRGVAGTPGPLRLLREAVEETLSRRRLIRYLVQAEMRKRGSDTLLGNIWWVLDPVLQMLVYMVLITILGRGRFPDYPLFIYAAILPWKWFTAVINDASTTVVRQERLIKQIAFPKIVLPVATTSAGVVGFAAGFVPLAGLFVIYAHRFDPLLVVIWVPIVAVVQYVFTLGVAIFVSAANVFFRDLGNALGHGLRLLWFLSPGIYSLAWMEELGVVQEHPIIRTLAGFNPLAILFESYRVVIYGTETGRPVAPDVVALAFLFLGSVVLIGLSMIFFKRLEPNFAKVL